MKRLFLLAWCLLLFFLSFGLLIGIIPEQPYGKVQSFILTVTAVFWLINSAINRYKERQAEKELYFIEKETEEIMGSFEKSGRDSFLEMLEKEEFVNEILLLVSPRKRARARILIEKRDAKFLDEMRYKYENSESEEASKKNFRNYMIFSGIIAVLIIIFILWSTIFANRL